MVDDDGPGDRPRDGRRAVRTVSGLVIGEGAALVGLSLAYLGVVLAGHPHNRGLAAFGAVLGLVAGAGLAVAGRALGRRRRAAYAPVLLAQLIAVPVGIGRIQGDQPLVAALVLGPALVTIALLVGTADGRSIVAEP